MTINSNNVVTTQGFTIVFYLCYGLTSLFCIKYPANHAIETCPDSLLDGHALDGKHLRSTQ